MNDPQHESHKAIPNNLAAALDALSGGTPLPNSQSGQSDPFIGPASVVRPRPVMSPPRRRPNPFSMQRTLIPILLVLGIFLPALGVAQRLINQDNPLSAQNLPAISILLPILGAVLLLLAILNMLSVRNKLRRSM